jgi:8-oxo-dGTP pyrophosphatase MutT (NUDIX family)
MSAAIAARIAREGIDALRPFLLQELPQPSGDFDPADWPEGKPELAEAAVLLPIILRREPTLLFTRRSENLSRHSGQVSFPGGCTEAQDISPVETALRETQEETGIDPAFITIAGFLERYETGTGFAIQPVVGMVSEGFALIPDRREVAAIFEVPLAFLLDPANVTEHHGEYQGRLRHYHAFTYEGHRIWGATAALLRNFGERLGAW